MAEDGLSILQTAKKPAYPIGAELRGYLVRWGREAQLPVSYRDMMSFSDSAPLYDTGGTDTLWESVIYPREQMTALHHGLKEIYALMQAEGSVSVMDHLYVDRIDYCTFGNSNPFRVRIVNAYNDNFDHFYVKKADASRVYGLELEHLLSPNRLHFLTSGDTLVEEHIAGIPGDVFIQRWLHDPNVSSVRLAKELVKFNERCFVRLLGDMRAYNFVIVLVPDFEGVQVRLRAMDFDQQSYNGRLRFYLPQFFKDNLALVEYCQKRLNPQTARQYQREEQALIFRRAETERARVGQLLGAMEHTELATREKVTQLGAELAAHHQLPHFAQAATMGALVRESLALSCRQFAERTGHSGPNPFLAEGLEHRAGGKTFTK
jgi:hypothetical protein